MDSRFVAHNECQSWGIATTVFAVDTSINVSLLNESDHCRDNVWLCYVCTCLSTVVLCGFRLDLIAPCPLNSSQTRSFSLTAAEHDERHRTLQIHPRQTREKQTMPDSLLHDDAPVAAAGSGPASPQRKRPLKRTASTASLPPTPPRTYSRYSRGRSRGSCDSDESDNDAVVSSDDETSTRHKKQRTSKQVAGDGDEEAFWLGGAEDNVAPEEQPRGRDLTRGNSSTIHSGPSNEDKSDIPLLYRKRRAQLQAKARVQAQSSSTLDSAPVSPPPSHRKPIAPPIAPTTPPRSTVLDPSKLITPSPPVTLKTRRQRALLDSPDNPFLDTPEPAEDSATPSPETATDSSPKTPAPFQEKPTITYVL